MRGQLNCICKDNNNENLKIVKYERSFAFYL